MRYLGELRPSVTPRKGSACSSRRSRVEDERAIPPRSSNRCARDIPADGTSRTVKNSHMQREFPLFGPLQTMERYYNDVFGSYIEQIFAHNGSFPLLQADSSCGCQNRGDANEVVGSGRENEEPFNQAATAVPGLAEATNGFQPAERLLDLLSLDRADAIARVARGPRVNCRPAIGVILGHMRRAATLATSGDEVRGVIVFVGAHGASRLGIVIDHVKGGGAFSCAVGFSEPRVDDESVAVLCHQMAHVTELCLFSGALAEQPCIRIGCREVRVIRAFLAMKVALGVASATGCSTSRWRRVTTILGNKALHARPSLDQRTVDREVLAREQAADLRQVQDAGHELTGNIAVQQTVPVLAENCGIPDQVVHRQADEPAEQKIVFELLHQQAFRTHGIERLEQKRSQQPFRRDRRLALSRIKLAESRRQLQQGFVDELSDRAQRVVRRNPRLKAYITEQTVRLLVLAAHRPTLDRRSPMHRIITALPNHAQIAA